MRKLIAYSISTLLISLALPTALATAQETRVIVTAYPALPGYPGSTIDTRDLSGSRESWFSRCAEPQPQQAEPAMPGNQGRLKKWSSHGYPSDCPTNADDQPADIPVWGKPDSNRGNTEDTSLQGDGAISNQDTDAADRPPQASSFQATPVQ